MNNFSKTIILTLWLVAIAMAYYNYSPQIKALLNGDTSVTRIEISAWDEAMDLNERGLVIQKSDSKLAEQLYKQAIEKDSTFYYAYNNLGILYSDDGRSQEAFDMYEKAIQIKPDYAKAYNNLGVWYYDSGNHLKAKEMYEKSISITQTDPNPYGNIAIILEGDENNTKAAIPFYKKAIELGSTNATVIKRAKELNL